MDPRFQTSFIPKKPIVAQTKVYSASSINLLSLISTVIFIASLAAGGGAFFYNNLISKQIEDNKATLERAKDAFEPELIAKIVRLDTRIQTAKGLLASHLTITPIFDFVSTITLRTVRFRDFSYSYLGPDKVLVSMRGQAQGYASVALQSDLLYQQKSLKDTIVSDMVLDPSGSVLFNVSTVIDSSLVSYSGALSRESGVQQEAPAPAAPAAPQVPVQQIPASNNPATSTPAATSTPTTGTSTTTQ